MTRHPTVRQTEMKVYRETNWYVWSDVAAGRVPGSGSGAVGSGWRALFNGKDLIGWKQNGDEKWIVEKVTIMGESTANKYGYLTPEKSYRDFDLRLKFKGETAGNSGFFFTRGRRASTRSTARI